MNTTAQKLAAVFGVVFILIAIAGFIAPGGMAMQPTDPATSAQALGMFPVNLAHNIVHLLFGLWGLAGSRSWSGSFLSEGDVPAPVGESVGPEVRDPPGVQRDRIDPS